MKYARVIESGELEMVIIPLNRPQLVDTLVEDGFIPLELEERPSLDELGELESYILRHRVESDHIVGYYEIEPLDPVKVAAKIESLKTELCATDYKVLKNHEYQIMGLPYEYDPEELHNNREATREAIRELEPYLE